MSMGEAATLVRAKVADEAAFIPGIDADGSLYPIEKMQAHRSGALHLAVSVFVMAGDALLLQQRAHGKYHSGGLWANTCCSHPSWGEAIAAGARRRLREEMGLSTPLRACNVIDYAADVTDGLREHERVHVFRGDVASVEATITPDPAEVCAVRWMTRGEIERSMARDASAYAPWFRIYLSRWDELGL
jgi:isopentenyl-diphosphate delta-isomerase